MSDFRFYAAVALIVLGLLFSFAALVGVWRVKDPLLRIHTSAMNDTLGMGLLFLGLMLLSGLGSVTFKLLCTLAIYWIVSPITGHLLANLELKEQKSREG